MSKGRVAAIVVLVALMVVGGAAWWGLIQMGLARAPFDRMPAPTDRDVQAARSEAQESLASFAATTGLAAWPDASSPPAEMGRGDHCVEGQHNWKIDDPYDLRCTAVVLQTGAHRPLTAWRDDALALHARLVEAGWTPAAGGDVDALVREYWDPRANWTASGNDANGDGAYGPADLPDGRYEHAEQDVVLFVHYLEPGIGYVLTATEAARGHHPALLEAAGALPPATYAPLLEYTTTSFEG